MIKPICFLLFFSAAGSLFAQAGTVDVKGSAGITTFKDEVWLDSQQAFQRSWLNHLQTGASVRVYVTRRLSIEPEFQYLRQSKRHDDLIFVPNVNWDFREGRVVPYMSAGFGYARSRFKDVGPSIGSNDFFFQAGGGAKMYLVDGLFFSPDFRVGSDAHFRASIGFGFTFGR